jgi:hypothetical protein
LGIPPGASSVVTAAPLHERFNETREMTEIAYEVETALPWAGGFVLDLGAEPEPWRMHFANEREVVLESAAGLELRWRLAAAAGEEAVTLRGFEATLGSAT